MDSKELAKALLEGMDASDDEGAHTEKDAADRAALEAFYVRTGQRSPAAQLAERVMREVPSEGAFDPIDEVVSPHVTLRVGPLESEPVAGRYVQVRVETESGGTVSWQFLSRGLVGELVAKLRSPGIVAEIDAVVAELVAMQKRQALP